MSNKTTFKKKQDARHAWYVVDAEDKVLGRAATKIATLLMGKHTPDYTQHTDSGAGVIVLNCGKVRVTGKKGQQKQYTSFSGYPGGLKKISFDKMMVKDPKYALRHAVKGMLPKNKIAVFMLRRLKLYVGKDHRHLAQNPVEVKL